MMTTTPPGHVDHASAGSWIFGAAALAATASAVYQFLDDQGEPGFRFLLLALLMMVLRWAKTPTLFATAFATFVLVAAWASVQHWYRDIVWADEVVHFLTPGSLAAVAYFLLAQGRLLPEPRQPSARVPAGAPVLWVVLVGVFAAVLWEFYEWGVEQVSPQGMLVGYTDTVLDLAAGMLGSITAGALVLWWARSQERSGAEGESQSRR